MLAFARSYSSSGPKFSAGGQAAPPAPPAKISPSKGLAQPIFPARQKLRGDIRRSDLAQVGESFYPCSEIAPRRLAAAPSASPAVIAKERRGRATLPTEVAVNYSGSYSVCAAASAVSISSKSKAATIGLET